MARNAARPDPARDRRQLARTDQGAHLVLGARELDGELLHGQGGPFDARSMRQGTTAMQSISIVPTIRSARTVARAGRGAGKNDS